MAVPEPVFKVQGRIRNWDRRIEIPIQLRPMTKGCPRHQTAG